MILVVPAHLEYGCHKSIKTKAIIPQGLKPAMRYNSSPKRTEIVQRLAVMLASTDSPLALITANLRRGYLSNPTIEGGGDVTNLSPVEDGNDKKTTPSGDRFDLITG